jgi:hypothetical protein
LFVRLSSGYEHEKGFKVDKNQAIGPIHQSREKLQLVKAILLGPINNILQAHRFAQLQMARVISALWLFGSFFFIKST